MKVLLELDVEGTVSTNELKNIGHRAVEAISGTGGPKVHPRLLVEMSPNYLEISLDGASKSKAV